MNIALILSGGIGSRMMTNNIPKQYMLFREKPIICYSLDTFNCHSMIDKIVIVADEAWRKNISEWISEFNIGKFASFAEPGENRQLSILNGLKIISEFAEDNDSVIIHDAARPLISAELITRCLSALDGHDGVMPVLSAKDTFYVLDENGKASKMLPRSLLAAGQAPEVFRFGSYYRANLNTSDKDILRVNGSTEMALLHGLDITTIPGDEKNIKITTQNDLILLESYFKEMNP